MKRSRDRAHLRKSVLKVAISARLRGHGFSAETPMLPATFLQCTCLESANESSHLKSSKNYTPHHTLKKWSKPNLRCKLNLGLRPSL